MALNMWSFMQNEVQQRLMNLQLAVVVARCGGIISANQFQIAGSDRQYILSGNSRPFA
jgi:hypothetical protein